MNDVESVMKVNKLAQDLLNQGLVASREDAVQRAQEMLSKEIAGNDIKMEETETKQNIEVGDNNLEKLKNAIDRSKEYNERHFKHFKEHLEALYKEVNTLKDEVANLKSRGVSKTVSDSGLNNKKVEEASAEPKHVAQSSQGDNHPKNGNANSDDVSVEKMFYFGRK